MPHPQNNDDAGMGRIADNVSTKNDITFTLRQSGTLIRVISARDMHRKERAVYEQAKKDA